MSLNFDVSKIVNHQVVTTHPDDLAELEKADPAQRTMRWHPTTDALVWLCMICDMNAITEKNWPQFFMRVHAYETMCGAYKRKYGGPDGKDIVDDPITVEDVKAHIGLQTNVSQSTDAAFAKKLLRWANDNAKQQIGWAEKRAGEKARG